MPFVGHAHMAYAGGLGLAAIAGVNRLFEKAVRQYTANARDLASTKFSNPHHLAASVKANVEIELVGLFLEYDVHYDADVGDVKGKSYSRDWGMNRIFCVSRNFFFDPRSAFSENRLHRGWLGARIHFERDSGGEKVQQVDATLECSEARFINT